MTIKISSNHLHKVFTADGGCQTCMLTNCDVIVNKASHWLRSFSPRFHFHLGSLHSGKLFPFSFRINLYSTDYHFPSAKQNDFSDVIQPCQALVGMQNYFNLSLIHGISSFSTFQSFHRFAPWLSMPTSWTYAYRALAHNYSLPYYKLSKSCLVSRKLIKKCF